VGRSWISWEAFEEDKSNGPVVPFRGTAKGGSWNSGTKSLGGGITYDIRRLVAAGMLKEKGKYFSYMLVRSAVM
jgi:hypothetical protein